MKQKLINKAEGSISYKVYSARKELVLHYETDVESMKEAKFILDHFFEQISKWESLGRTGELNIKAGAFYNERNLSK